MAKFEKGHLAGEYSWTEFHADDPKVSGAPDDTLFNAREGHEVLYLINTLTKEWDLRNAKSGMKIERMLRDLPSEVRSQSDVKSWIKDKWKSYKSKDAVMRRSTQAQKGRCASPSSSNGESSTTSPLSNKFLKTLRFEPFVRWWTRLIKG